jgi:HSP20 family protein
MPATTEEVLKMTLLRSFAPLADVSVTPEHVSVVMDVPGFKPGELDIELVDDFLTIRGERAFPHAHPDGSGRTWRRFERGYGRFERSLRMPAGLDPDTIQASLQDGVLNLLIPMPESRKPRKIQVLSGADRPAIEQESEDRELATA